MIRLLVVDDEIDVCDFLKHFFELRKFQVFTALNGTEAIRLLRKEKPELVLLDIKMKDIDGIATLKKMREFDKAVKVIMVTAVEGDEGKMKAARKLGACEYITKPLVLENLAGTVKAHVGEGKNE